MWNVSCLMFNVYPIGFLEIILVCFNYREALSDNTEQCRIILSHNKCFAEQNISRWGGNVKTDTPNSAGPAQLI